MPAHLQFALAIFAVTWGAAEWLRRVDPADDWAPLARLFAPAAAALWAVVVVAFSVSGTWSVGVPAASAFLTGAALISVGVVVLHTTLSARGAARAGWWPTGLSNGHGAPVGVVLGLAGVAVLGRSGFGVVLVVLFGLLAWRASGIEHRGAEQEVEL